MLFDFAVLDPLNSYKLMTSTVVPRPIAWVVTQDEAGQTNAAPFSFFNAFCGDPPVIGIGISRRVPGHTKDTARNIADTGEFVVNLVNNAVSEQMNITGIEFPREVDELVQAGLTPVASTKVKPPRIAESPVAFECTRMTILELAPERVLVVGRVLAMHVRDDCVRDPVRCHIDTPKLDLIGRMHGGGWYARTTDRFDMPRIPLADWQRRE